MTVIPSVPVAALARQALDEISRTPSDARTEVGDRYLGTIADSASASEVERMIAASARETARLKVYASTSQNGQRVALDILAAGPGAEPPERQLVKLALAEMKTAQCDSDRVLIANGTLAQLERTSSDPTVQGQIRVTREMLGDGSTADLSTLRIALDAIASGSRVLEIPLKGSRLTLRLPVAPVADGPVSDGEMALLGECVPHNRQVMNTLGYQLKTNQTAIPALEKDLADRTAAFDTLAVSQREAQKRLSHLQGVQGLSSLAFAGGALAALSGTPVGAVISVAGLGSLAFTLFKVRGAAAVVQGQTDTLDKQLTARYDAIDHLNRARRLAESAQELLARAEPLVRPLDERYRVGEMTRLAGEKKPDPDAHIDVDGGYVTIGKVRVARKDHVPS